MENIVSRKIGSETTHYICDALGRVTEVSYPDTNTTIASYDYLGNRIIGKTFANANLKYEVASDSLGRITAETIKKISPEDTLKTNSYTYAANTNRLGSRNGLSYTYNNLAQLVGAGTSAYTFDTLGNPTNAQANGYSYLKNKEDRITEVKDAQNTVLADYQYDAAGRRAKKTVNSVDTSFVYGLNGAVLSEISGSTAREYVYGAAGEVIYMHSSAGNGSGRYLVTDFKNSVIAKRNSDGTLTQIDYNAWGEPTVSQGGSLEGLSVLWNGYYYDDETGNYYLRNRYYSPQERNFITEDPRGINPSRNWNNHFAVHAQYNDGYGLSVYAKSDPVNGRDDWGWDVAFLLFVESSLMITGFSIFLI